MIYLDNNATTPVDPRVLDVMIPILRDEYGNAASNHAFGNSSNQKIKQARESIASILGSETNEIIFTSGATEAINLAIKGIALATNKGKHIVTVSTEHPAVLDTCKYLEGVGFEVTYLSVQSNGLISLDELNRNIRTDTILVSVMLVNNETGVIQPINEIAELVHSKGSILMTDATQAVGKLPIDVDQLGIDLMPFSGHKIYGPKGVGGLFVRGRRPNKVKLLPNIHGGGHEMGMRSGTLNVPGIVGLGAALHIAKKQMDEDAALIGSLRDILERELLTIENTFVNGDTSNRIYSVSNLCFIGADADAMMVGLNDIMVSNGSACTSTKVEPSHVLRAMGRTDEEAYSSIRFSLGRFTSKKDVETTISQVKKVVQDLRMMVT